MNRYPLALELEDDLVLSRRNSTTGGHECLTWLPGSALRGWAAGRLYDALGADDAFRVFHSGAVRFGDALPAGPQGQPGRPLPLSWHSDKADPDGRPESAGRWVRERIFNLAAPDAAGRHSMKQPRALRDGFVTADGAAPQPLRRDRMMTAIGEHGTVAAGQLFGYQSLVRGQRFIGHLSFDDGLPDALVQRVVEAFDGMLRLGRSRATGYGRVRSSVGVPQPSAPVTSVDGERLQLWLLSDAWLRDANGQPSLRPDGDSLGLPGAVLVLEHSFLRARRVSPWNAHRALPEMERQTLVAGSVITLSRPGGFSAAALQPLADRGIGAGRALGLGEVAVQPRLLQTLHPVFEAPVAAQAAAAPSRDRTTAAPVTPATSTPLLAFLRARAPKGRHGDHARAFVESELGLLVQRWKSVRAYEALPPGREMGPGPSQWGLVAALAARHPTLAGYRIELLGADEDKTPKGAVPARDEHWDAHACRQRDAAGAVDRQSLRTWLAQALDRLAANQDLASDADRLDAWQRLCADVRRKELHLGQIALDRVLAHHRMENA